MALIKNKMRTILSMLLWTKGCRPGAAEEVSDLEVLLEPFEEELDLPALLVEGGDLGGSAKAALGYRPVARLA
jgi:hypothetical protein